uniref:Odorant receptor n=1 Tax=Grapholita molesta TaxID=192188 RepID=A0A9Y1ISQ7_GRAMO|nr:odorant-receptor-23 [Grapholita molesta]
MQSMCTKMRPESKNKTLGLFHTICKIVYVCCGINFWFENMTYPAKLMKIYSVISKVLEVSVIALLISDFGAFYTQTNLTDKQSADRLLFAIAHPIIYFVYVSVGYYKQEFRDLVKTLALVLKDMFNDEWIEKLLFRSTFRYLTALGFVCCSTLFSYGVENGISALMSNATFTTVIPVWPNVEERSPAAGAIRVVVYIIWWILVIRSISVYFVVLTSTIALTHQFKSLCKYFENLNDIFEGSGTQAEKERRYEDAFKVGIKMHSITLWCARQIQKVANIAFSAQVIITVGVLFLLMIQMMFTERTLMAVMPIVSMASCILIGTGVFVWNAGDVTIEAAHLPAAMFHSGWYNCTRQSSVRVRKLVTIAIAQAQKRVAIKGLGFMELSYEAYVTIVKSSYSLFSVIY